MVPGPKSKFLRVKCDDCSNEQVMFDSATSIVKCHVCGRTLSSPRGGKAKILTKTVSILE